MDKAQGDMDKAQRDLVAWRDAIEDLAVMAKAITADKADGSNPAVQHIRDTRKLEREAWRRFRANWKEAGES